MQNSGQINELLRALAAAQGEFKNPSKDRTAKVPMKAGGSYEYHYADLATTIDTVRPVLAKHGLSLTQIIDVIDGRAFICTVLGHSSGQFMSGSYPMPMPGDGIKPQEIGSYITYLRRYCLSSILGLAADEDEDGALASEKAPARKPAAPATPRPSPVKPVNTPDSVVPPTQNAGFMERGQIVSLAQKYSWKLDEVREFIGKAFDGASKVEDLTVDRAEQLAHTISTTTFKQAMAALV